MQTKGNFMLFNDVDEFATWLDNQTITRSVTKLQVHHTASPNYTTRKGQDYFVCLEGMRNYHVNTNGWSATGQNLTVFEDGKIALSLDRDLNKTPAGISGANTGAICIENIGNFDVGGDTITQVQKDAIVSLYAVLAIKFNLTVDTNHIVYHGWYTASGTRLNDYTPGRSSKSCPGTNFFGVGNTVAAANKSLIPLVTAKVKEIKNQKVVEEVVATLSKYFNDVYKEWQASAIDGGKEKGIFAVPDDKTFKPDTSITRAEVAVIVERTINYVLAQVNK